MNTEYTFQGCAIPTEETFMLMLPKEGEYQIEFGFEPNETGYIYEDGTVFYDHQGLFQYQFKSRENALAFLFNLESEEFEYQQSFYVGSREDHPTLDGWCKRMGIGVQEEEDGSSVFSAWKTTLYK